MSLPPFSAACYSCDAWMSGDSLPLELFLSYSTKKVGFISVKY
jgi:hypothetical protein